MGESTGEKRVRNESGDRSRQPPSRRRADGTAGCARTSELKLDTEAEQTAKASYYLSSTLAILGRKG